MTRFILLCHQRCGSNALSTILSQCPDVAMYGQLFKESLAARRELAQLGLRMYKRHGEYDHLVSRDAHPLSRWESPKLKFGRRASDLPAFLDRFYAKLGETTGRTHLGFKLHGYQLSGSDYQWLFDCGKFGFIVLHRRNLLAAAVSWQMALRTSEWVHLDVASQAAEQALTLDIEALRWFIDQTRAQVSDWLSSLSKSESPYLELEYESARSPSRQQRIWEFLGVDASVPVLRPTTRKIMTDDRYRWIANLSEIETELGSDENGTLLSPGDSGE